MKAEFDPSPDAYEPGPYEIAGFDLFGERQLDGSVLIGPPLSSGISGLPDERKSFPDFPPAVKVCGVVYTLEYINKNDQPPGHAGHNIEWGVYV